MRSTRDGPPPRPLSASFSSLYTSGGACDGPVWGVYKGSGLCAIGRSAASAAGGDGSAAGEHWGEAERHIYTPTYRHSHPFQPCPTWHASHARAGSSGPPDPTKPRAQPSLGSRYLVSSEHGTYVGPIDWTPTFEALELVNIIMQ